MARSLWMFSLIPEAVSVGLASILIPLFVIINLKGSLMDVGLVAGVSGIALIPSVMLFGSLADRFAKCKIFIAFSFAGMGVSFLLTANVVDINGLLIVNTLRTIFYAASLPTRQILIVESDSRSGWEGGIARIEFLTGVGEAIGIAIGSFTNAEMGFVSLFTICGVLSLGSAFAAMVMIKEPGLMIERRLLSLERFTNTLAKASTIVSNANRYSRYGATERISEIFSPSVKLFLIGVFAFSLAGKALFIPLPVYFLDLYPESMVFILFFMNSAANTFSYLFVTRVGSNSRRVLVMSSLLRVFLVFLLAITVVPNSAFGLASAAAILILLGVVWAFFDVSSTCLYLELSQIGRTGYYSALIGISSAVGSFVGGYISMYYGFNSLFTFCSSMYIIALILFILQFNKWSRM